MIKWIQSGLFGTAITLTFATTGSATIIPVPISNVESGVIRVAEGCGEGFWRGPHGHCHPFAKGRECPRGYHLGAEGKKCWPN
jgi:hypothetical protein